MPVDILVWIYLPYSCPYFPEACYKKKKKKNCRVGLQMSVYFKDYEHLTGTVDPDRLGVPSHEAILK